MSKFERRKSPLKSDWEASEQINHPLLCVEEQELEAYSTATYDEFSLAIPTTKEPSLSLNVAAEAALVHDDDDDDAGVIEDRRWDCVCLQLLLLSLAANLIHWDFIIHDDDFIGL